MNTHTWSTRRVKGTEDAVHWYCTNCRSFGGYGKQARSATPGTCTAIREERLETERAYAHAQCADCEMYRQLHGAGGKCLYGAGTFKQAVCDVCLRGINFRGRYRCDCEDDNPK